MIMDFRVADPVLLHALKPGQRVVFEIAEESAGEYIIIHIHPMDAHAVTGRHREH